VSVHRINIGGGIKIGSDGSYSSEYSLPQIHASCADELVRMEFRRDVILAFRKAHDYPKGARAAQEDTSKVWGPERMRHDPERKR
jgi:hypothetical protein